MSKYNEDEDFAFFANKTIEANDIEVIEEKDNIAFTWFKDKTSKCAKSYDVVDGKLVKGGFSNFYNGEFTAAFENRKDLKRIIELTQTGQFIIAGVHPDKDRGTCGADFGRKKENFPFQDIPSLLIIDTDNADKFGIKTFQDTIDLLKLIEPVLENVQMVCSPSASSNIVYNGVDSGLRGVHSFIPISSGLEITRVIEILHKRSVIEGFGFAMITESGSVLIKSLVDTAMKTSNQICLEGGANLKSPLITQERTIVEFEGGVLDASKIKPLTALEQAKFDDISTKLKKDAEPQALIKHAEWRVVRGAEMRVSNRERYKNMSEEEIQADINKSLDKALGGKLDNDFVIHTVNFGQVSVGEILADKAKFKDVVCSDPIEPFYKKDAAKIWVNDDGSVNISSLAHQNLTNYVLCGKDVVQESNVDIDDLDAILNIIEAAAIPLPAYVATYKQALLEFKSLYPNGALNVLVTEYLATLNNLETGKEVSKDFHLTMEKIISKLPVKKERFQLTDSIELIKSKKPIEWAICGLLEESGMNQLSGKYASGKSFITLDMAFCLATGLDYHGIKVKQQPVIIVVGEGLAGISNRLKALQIGYGVKLKPGQLSLSTIAGNFTEIEQANIVKEAIHKIAPEGVNATVIIDTLNRNFGAGDENSNKDMTAFISNLDNTLKDKTVLIVHHTGHGDSERGRGASSLPGACEGEFLVKKDSDGNFILTNKKQKNAEEHKPLTFKPRTIELDTVRADGIKETSLFLESTVNAISRAKKTNDTYRNVLDALKRVCLNEGKLPDEELKLQYGRFLKTDGSTQHVCFLKEWKTEAYKFISHDDKNKHQTFNRIKDKILENGEAMFFNDRVWATGDLAMKINLKESKNLNGLLH